MRKLKLQVQMRVDGFMREVALFGGLEQTQVLTLLESRPLNKGSLLLHYQA